MTITDLNGFPIEVTDLEKAIEQAEYFKDCEHVPPMPSDRERQKYWGDMYVKLLEAKAKTTDSTH